MRSLINTTQQESIDKSNAYESRVHYVVMIDLRLGAESVEAGEVASRKSAIIQ
jgi:hypothetical protein